MAKYTTASGLEFNSSKGSAIGSKFPSSGTASYNGVALESNGGMMTATYGGKTFNIPYYDMASLQMSELAKAIKKTVDEGKPLSKQDYYSIVGGKTNGENKWSYYNYLLDQNSQTLGYDSSVYTKTGMFDANGKLKDGADFSSYLQGGATQQQTESAFNQDGTINPSYLNTLQQQAYQNYAGLMIDPNSAYGQQQAKMLYDNIDSQESQMTALLGNSELQAYKMLGQQQLELENTIAEQRMKALKSGTTSAQLAAQQIANIFSAQTGAATVAQNYQTQRIDNAKSFIEQRAQVMPSIYDQANANRTTLATSGAQNYAATAGLVSYANQQAGNLLSSNNFLTTYGKTQYNNIMNPNK